MASYRGVDRYFVLSQESTWNTYDDSSSTVLWPIGVGDDGASMMQDSGQNVLETNVGHGIPYYVNTGISSFTGTINCVVDETLGVDLVKWGSLITSSALPTYTLDIGGGESYERWTGLTVESMALTSGSDSGAQRLTAAISVVGGGYSQPSSGQVVEVQANYSPATGFMHSQCELDFDGTTNTTVRDLTINFNNVLDIGNGTGTTPSYIQFCGRQVTLDCTIEYDSDAYRAGFVAQPPTNFTLLAKYDTGSSEMTMHMQSACKVTAFTPVNSLGARATANISLLATSPTAPTTADFTVS